MTNITSLKPSDLELPSHVIGIGASAGGLEALQILLQNLPTNTGASFIIVQHLSPDFKSMMLELLSKHTTMNIVNVEDGMRLTSNTIYLIPPKKNMMVAQGELLLSDKMPDSGLSLPIDIFFRSLSEDQQHKAIGIILSGTGSDGSRGVKALKEAGALVIAQDPTSAKFDGMPNSAINTGIIDLILKPEEMGEKIQSYINHPLVSGDEHLLRHSENGNEDIMAEIFTVLKAKSEIDFAKYKPSTVARRIERRMTIKQVTSLQEYLTLLFKEPYEVQLLSKELLIGVTRFFRDDQAFNELRDQVIPQIVRESRSDTPIRIWTAGCSTGEEAYSIAMLVADEIKKRKIERHFKVFATDVNPDAIAEASTGVYSGDIEHDISHNTLMEHFSKQSDGTYQVNKELRKSVIFATHNMITDPPFSNMDLVSCRNILIYFQQSVQKRVLTSLHFSLRKGGVLFLGSSENLGDLAPHFSHINDRCRLYKKKNNLRIPIGSTPPSSPLSSSSSQHIPSVTRLIKNYRGASLTSSAVGFANEVLITHYAPPCILLNEEYEALHVYGDVSDFVRRLPPGRISIDIKDLVNEDISIAVSSAIHRCKQSRDEVYYSDIFTHNGEEQISLNIRARYIKEHELESSPGYYWLIFERCQNTLSKDKNSSVSFDAAEQARQRIEDLEFELKRNKEHLQVTVEELETTNEELQSANEELMSANEELQSTNEELQSVNEELYTVNSEYQEKIQEVSQANGDLDEVLSLSKIGIIFLDENLLIRRYTHAVSEYVNVMASDINRPLHHISTNINYPDLLQDVSAVFKSGSPIEKEILLEDKRVLKVSVHTYNYSDSAQTRGVAITFTDISQQAYSERGLAVAYNSLRQSVHNALDSLDTQPFKKNVTILVVDDSEIDQILMTDTLNDVNGFEVSILKAKNVEEATTQAADHPIDVCITDYYLGTDTAVELIEAFQQQNIKVPVLACSGIADRKTESMLLSYGILDFIYKDDMTPALLERCIRYAVRRNEIDSQIQQALSHES